MIGVPPIQLAGRSDAEAVIPAALAPAVRDALAGAALVALPVFLQAPWVRLAPASAAIDTVTSWPMIWKAT